MSRLLAKLASTVRRALRGLVASPVTSSVAAATIGISLVLVGAFFLLLRNMEGLLEQVGDSLRVTAYLEVGLGEPRRRELAELARGLPGVASVALVSEAEALERFRAGVGRGGALLEGLEENPLPASLEVVLEESQRSAAGLGALSASLERLDGVDDVASGSEWVEGYLRAVALVRWLGVGLGLILGLAALLIVANTIRLAVLARRDEIEILRLVGASRSFVSAPFVLEGVLEGLAGGALALLLLLALFHLALPGFAFGLELLLGSATPRFFDLGEAAWLLAGGAALGALGSGAALAGGLRA